jgi:hypothetical protein
MRQSSTAEKARVSVGQTGRGTPHGLASLSCRNVPHVSEPLNILVRPARADIRAPIAPVYQVRAAALWGEPAPGPRGRHRPSAL